MGSLFVMISGSGQEASSSSSSSSSPFYPIEGGVGIGVGIGITMTDSSDDDEDLQDADVRVHSIESLRTCIERIVPSGGIIFFNDAQEFRICLECFGTAGDDICVVRLTIEKDTASRDPIGLRVPLAHEDIADDGGGLIVFETDVEIIEGGGNNKTVDIKDDDLEELKTRINDIVRWSVCRGCKRRFLDSPDHDMCTFCVMTSTPEDLEKEMCVICQEQTSAKLFKQLPCCKQRMHVHCLASMKKRQCPLCRAALDASFSVVMPPPPLPPPPRSPRPPRSPPSS